MRERIRIQHPPSSNVPAGNGCRRTKRSSGASTIGPESLNPRQSRSSRLNRLVAVERNAGHHFRRKRMQMYTRAMLQRRSIFKQRDLYIH